MIWPPHRQHSPSRSPTPTAGLLDASVTLSTFTDVSHHEVPLRKLVALELIDSGVGNASG
jgi:hypothetical protein